MAIINCPECQREISNQAPTCPHCGIRIEGNIRTCPDCGKTVLRQATECPNCKCKLTPLPADNEADGGKHGKKHKPHSGGKASKPGVVLPIVLLVLVVAGIGLYKLYSDFQERQQMEAAYAALEDSYEARDYQTFLTHYPTSEHRQEVEERMEQLMMIDSEWAKTRTLLTQDNLRLFLKEHPKSKYTQECTYLIDSLDWEDCSLENTIDAYRTYLEQHPDGDFRSRAETAVENLENPQVTQDDRDKVRALLNDYFLALHNADGEALDTLTSEKMKSESLQLIKNSEDSLTFVLSGYLSLRKIPAPQVGNIYNAKFLVRMLTGGLEVIYSAEANISMNFRMQMLKMRKYVPTYEESDSTATDDTKAEPQAAGLDLQPIE